MGTLAVLPFSAPLPEGAEPVITAATSGGLIFLEIPSAGFATVDPDAPPPGLSQAAINDLCVIAQTTRAALTEWAARHTTPPRLEVLP